MRRDEDVEVPEAEQRLEPVARRRVVPEDDPVCALVPRPVSRACRRDGDSEGRDDEDDDDRSYAHDRLLLVSEQSCLGPLTKCSRRTVSSSSGGLALPVDERVDEDSHRQRIVGEVVAAERRRPRRTRRRGRSPRASGRRPPRRCACPATSLRSIMHIEWSPQRMPMPFASRTVLCMTPPIDISVIEIAAHRRPLDPVVLEHRRRRVRDDPLLAADDGAAGDHRLARVHVVRDVDSLAVGDAAHVDVAVRDRDRLAADVDAVELRADDGDVVEHDAAHPVDGDAVDAADDGDVADLDVLVRDDDAAADDGARRRRRASRGGRSRAAPGGRRRRDARPAAGARTRALPPRRAAPPPPRPRARRRAGRARRRPPRTRAARTAATRGRAAARTPTRPRTARARRRAARATPKPSTTAITTPSSSSPSGSAAQPGW